MSHYTSHQFLALEIEKSGLFAPTDEIFIDGLAQQATIANNLLRQVLVAEGAENSAAALAEARMHIAQLDTALQESQDPITRLRAMILAEDDVKTLHGLEFIGGEYCYLIETPFQTFPKFVIGTTNANNTQVRISHKCEALWQAEEAWQRLITTGSTVPA